MVAIKTTLVIAHISIGVNICNNRLEINTHDTNTWKKSITIVDIVEIIKIRHGVNVAALLSVKRFAQK